MARFCSNCGNEVGENAAFCVNCGYELAKQETAPVVEATPIVEETPVVEEAPVAEEAPAPEEVPVHEEAPIEEGKPIEETPITEETPDPEIIPVAEESVVEAPVVVLEESQKSTAGSRFGKVSLILGIVGLATALCSPALGFCVSAPGVVFGAISVAKKGKKVGLILSICGIAASFLVWVFSFIIAMFYY